MAIPQTRRVVTTDAAGNLPAAVLGSIPPPTWGELPDKPIVGSPVPATGIVTVAAGTTPTVIDMIDGALYGTVGSTGELHRSTDGGVTWTLFTTVAPVINMRRLVKTSDGEVLAMAAERLYKSTGWAGGSPTWRVVITPYLTSQFQVWSIAGDEDGTRFLTTEYTGTRPDSRYVRMSLDAGNTWQVVFDSVVKHGATLGNGSHLHGCCYDKWADRWYFTEGHDDGGTEGDIAGIWCSTDDGATWALAPGMRQNSGPTTLVATKDGLVCGSDFRDNGIYGVRREADPMKQQLRKVWSWQTGRPGLVGFSTKAAVDPETGIVYFGWATAFADVPPIIAGGTVETGGLVYSWPGGQVNSDRVANLVIPSPGRFVARVEANAGVHIVSGNLGKPAAQSATTADTSQLLGGTASDGSSLAGGRSAKAPSPRSTALGMASVAGTVNGDSTAVGNLANAADQATAVGSNAAASGIGGALALGRNSISSGSQSVTLGPLAKATANLTTAVGTSSEATVAGATAVGYTAKANHAYAVALGHTAITTATYQVAIGARAIEALEVATAPAAPAIDTYRLFAQDVGGKTQLAVRFNTGVVLPLATQDAVAPGVIKTGTATLVAGTVTVPDTAITANSVIRVWNRTIGGTPGALYVSAKTAGASFVITSTSAADTSVTQYEIVSY